MQPLATKQIPVIENGLESKYRKKKKKAPRASTVHTKLVRKWTVCPVKHTG